MGRPKGSKNKPKVPQSSQKTVEKLSNDAIIAKQSQWLNNPVEYTSSEQLHKQYNEADLEKLKASTELRYESDKQSVTLPNITAHVDSFDPLAGDTLVRVSTADSKVNPQGKYYQFMHPCSIEKPPFKYRFISVIKNGCSYSSRPFDDKEECHTVLKQLLETDTIPTHPNVYQN